MCVCVCVCVCVIVVTTGGWGDVGLWVAVCFLAKISLHRPTWKTTFARLTQSQAVSQSFRVFITFRSWEIRLSFIFRNSFLYKITVSFTMVIKRSPGGESSGDGRSTSKSTCAFPAWLHWRSTSIVYVQIEPRWTLTSEMVPFGSKSVTLAKHADRSSHL